MDKEVYELEIMQFVSNLNFQTEVATTSTSNPTTVPPAIPITAPIVFGSI
jgi:hypothetical protein